jgi:fatty-acyl-CoA synthase
VADTDLVQLLYTSGTTSKPKGAMMTHRALVHEYMSCIHALDLRQNDEPLHVMPLYHSAQMHVFLLPWLAVGAANDLLEVPDPGEILRRL